MIEGEGTPMAAQPSSIEPRPASSRQLGKYQLVATLGQGGMGTVYLALASGFGQFRKLLVVKELRQDLTRQEGFVSMFMDEAKLAARLAHPNVVQTFEASEVGDRYFLAMEYLDGQSLSTLLDRLLQSPTSKLSLWMHIQILCDALSGLHYAHELLDYDGSSLHVVHRDVSPQNVFVTYHGQVKVVDFGVAKVGNACVKTAPGMFVGKFSYAAPEQVVGGAVDARTDVFAVGVMLWRAIAGHPFSEQAPTPAACRARCEGLEPRIAQVVPSVDPALAQICDRALAVDPDKRFGSAKEFRSELQNYMKRSGVRVEVSEIGQLMHDVFDAERRALHAQIERAMRRTGVSETSVEELSMLHYADKEPTAVADLSSLIEVSLEHDDQKIQQGYAHSKVTLMPTASVQEPSIPMSIIEHKPQRRLLTVIAVSGLLTVGLLVAVLHNPSPPRVVVESRAAITASPPLMLQTPKPQASPPVVSEKVEAVAASAPTNLAVQRKPTAAVPSHVRARVTPPRLAAHAHEATAESAPLHVPVPEPTANQRAFEEGSELLFTRHTAELAIDRENPYR
jgi:serine/threonine-protein kinase